MNSIYTDRAPVVAFILALFVSACGSEVSTAENDRSGVDCPDGCLVSAREALRCTAGDPNCCELGDPTCDENGGEPPPDDGGGSAPTVGVVTVRLINNTSRQATFYADGGGVYAFTTYHITQWLPAGGQVDLVNAMSGPIGSTLAMSTMLAAEGLPHYTLNSGAPLLAAHMLCTVVAYEDAQGFGVLSSSCVAG